MRRLVFTFLILLPGILAAQDFGAKTQASPLVDPATASDTVGGIVRLEHEQAAPGTEVLAGVSFSIPKHWHIF